MEMIGHEEDDLGVPLGELVIVADGAEKLLGEVREGQLFEAAFLAIDRDEEGGVVGNPVGGLVVEFARLTLGAGVGEHGRTLWDWGVGPQGMVGGREW